MVFKWHEKLVKKVTGTNLSLAILGKTLIAFSLGAIFSIQLVQYGYFILIASTIIIVSYLNTNFMSWHKNIKVQYRTHIKGFFGGFLLVIFLGIQSPHVPFKTHILITGFILIIPALINIMGGKRK